PNLLARTRIPAPSASPRVEERLRSNPTSSRERASPRLAHPRTEENEHERLAHPTHSQICAYSHPLWYNNAIHSNESRTMASQALYRRYRSPTFDELIGQEHIVQTLHNALAEGRIAHAYLFTGPRGVGKTTVARLLAKAVNCTADMELRPCGECESCTSLADGSAV